MNKIIALVMALFLALSAPLTLAEEASQAAEDGHGARVMASGFRVDRDAVSEILEAVAPGGAARSAVDLLLAVLNAYGDQLTIAENGIDYRLYLNDVQILYLTAGLTDEGFVLRSSLLPGFVVTLSDETIDLMANVADLASQLVDAMREARAERIAVERPARGEKGLSAILAHFEALVKDLAAAIRFGEPEAGEFNRGDGRVYNTRMPVVVDMQAVDAALRGMIANMSRDEAVLEALDNVRVEREALADMTELAELIPSLDATLYAMTDENGETAPDTCFVIMMCGSEQADALASLAIHTRPAGFDCVLDIPGEDGNDGIAVDFRYAAPDAENDVGNVALAVNFRGLYAAVEGVKAAAGDGSVREYVGTIYLLNADEPLATISTRIGFDETATLDLSTGGRKIIALESLLGSEGPKAISKLRRYILLAGLGVISAATEAVPELADLMSLLNAWRAPEATPETP